MSDEEIKVVKKKSKVPENRRQPKKVMIPRRKPSTVVPPKRPIFITADKTTCAECECYPQQDPYVKDKKLNPCQKSPKTLYELAAVVVDSLPFPEALNWTIGDVAMWMQDEVGLPQYTDSILNNYINGTRLLMLEDPSNLAAISVTEFKHIQMIVQKVRQIFGIEFIKFVRSIGLPPRKPLTHCTIFKSRTGPSWGIRKTWTRCDVLRWMKIITPGPMYLDHWDLVWYQKPEFPKVKFARIKEPYPKIYNYIPHYEPQPEMCREYLVPRKFIIQKDIPPNEQKIWMEMITEKEIKKEVEVKKTKPRKSTLMPVKINLSGLTGKDFILARRKMARPKFLP